MIIIICLDDNNGMTFNHRRQSQDKQLREYMLKLIFPNQLYMNAYSGKQFVDVDKSKIVINDAFLDNAQAGDYCFVENIDITPYIESIEEIILFRWNRNYPADSFFPLDILKEWGLVSTEDFSGYSHEKITKEIYRR